MAADMPLLPLADSRALSEILPGLFLGNDVAAREEEE